MARVWAILTRLLGACLVSWKNVGKGGKKTERCGRSQVLLWRCKWPWKSPAGCVGSAPMATEQRDGTAALPLDTKKELSAEETLQIFSQYQASSRNCKQIATFQTTICAISPAPSSLESQGHLSTHFPLQPRSVCLQPHQSPLIQSPYGWHLNSPFCWLEPGPCWPRLPVFPGKEHMRLMRA